MASASSQELDVVKFIGRPLKSFTRRSHKAQQLCGGWVQSTVSHMMRQAHPIQQSNIVSHAIVVSVPGHRHPYSRLDSHHTRTNQQLLYTPFSSNITCRLNVQPSLAVFPRAPNSPRLPVFVYIVSTRPRQERSGFAWTSPHYRS